MRWVKTPVDLHRRLAALPLQARSVMYGCFELARRKDPLRGYLVTETLRPLSIRDLAEQLVIPRGTVHRWVSHLAERRYLIQDFAGFYLVPLVLEIERPDPRKTDDAATLEPLQMTMLPGTGGEDENPGHLAVENGGRPDHPIAVFHDVSVPLADRSLPLPVRQWDNHSSYVFREVDVETLRSVDREEAGENLDLGAGDLLADVMADLPESISLPNVRYLLAKLRRTRPAWRDFPTCTRDIELVERLEALSPRALLGALEQETIWPTAKRPGAWLHHVLRRELAAGNEVAS